MIRGHGPPRHQGTHSIRKLHGHSHNDRRPLVFTSQLAPSAFCLQQKLVKHQLVVYNQNVFVTLQKLHSFTGTGSDKLSSPCAVQLHITPHSSDQPLECTGCHQLTLPHPTNQPKRPTGYWSLTYWAGESFAGCLAECPFPEGRDRDLDPIGLQTLYTAHWLDLVARVLLFMLLFYTKM